MSGLELALLVFLAVGFVVSLVMTAYYHGKVVATLECLDILEDATIEDTKMLLARQ